MAIKLMVNNNEEKKKPTSFAEATKNLQKPRKTIGDMAPKPKTVTSAMANAKPPAKTITSSLASNKTKPGKRQALPTENLSDFRARMAEKKAKEAEASREPTDLERLIDELVGNSKSGFTWDSRAEDEAMINEIFGSQLSAIANARNQTNSRYQESSTNSRNLYAGHEAEIKGADAANYQKIANENTAATNQNYDSAVSQAQTTQSQNRAAGEEMLQRLGQQGSAGVIQETANEQQGAIDALVKAKASQQAQNQTYATADQSMNAARAQSVAADGVSKQADLSRQLESILGELTNKEADINSSKAEAMYGARKQAESNWRGDRDYSTDALAQLMEAQGKNSAEGSSINAPAMLNILNGLGINDPALQQDYSSAYTDAVMNANYVPGMNDQTSAYLKYMVEKNPNLDENILLGLTKGDLNYGSYKVGAPSS